VDQSLGKLPRIATERAVAALAKVVWHARACAGIGILRPHPSALAQQVGSRRAAIAAHAAECDHTATITIMLGQVEHHLIDGRAVRLRPAATGEAHATVIIEAHFLTDRHHHHFATTNRIAGSALVDLPLAMPTDRLR